MRIRFATPGMNAVTLVISGILGFSAATIVLRLPQRIHRGERGQEAIAKLDAMRRPFLAIKQAEVRLLNTDDARASNGALSLAIASAAELLESYEALARYNVALSTNVGELSTAFEIWMTAEHRLFTSLEAASGGKGGRLPAGDVVSDLASVTSGFLHTMDVLGAGEAPMHADILDGRRAAHLFQVFVLIESIYFTAVAFWLQRTMGKRRARFLAERLRLEQEAGALERALGEALAKVLSGFIPICASCKRIRGQDNQWAPVESYVTEKTGAKFSHSICPECRQRLYRDLPPRTAEPESP